MSRNGRRVNAKSIMGVMMLAAGLGSEVEIETNGSTTSRPWTRSRCALINGKFGERRSRRLSGTAAAPPPEGAWRHEPSGRSSVCLAVSRGVPSAGAVLVASSRASTHYFIPEPGKPRSPVAAGARDAVAAS